MAKTIIVLCVWCDLSYWWFNTEYSRFDWLCIYFEQQLGTTADQNNVPSNISGQCYQQLSLNYQT